MRSSIIHAVHAIETHAVGQSLPLCENPVCGKGFNPTCLPWNHQRFCSSECRQQASILKRAAVLLLGFSNEQVLKVLGR